MKPHNSDKRPHLRYMPDSREQIEDSIAETGLRGQLHQCFQKPITRARSNRQESVEPAVDDSGKDKFDNDPA